MDLLVNKAEGLYAQCEQYSGSLNDLVAALKDFQERGEEDVAVALLKSLPKTVKSRGFWRVNNALCGFLKIASPLDNKALLRLTVDIYHLCGEDLARGLIFSALGDYLRRIPAEIVEVCDLVFDDLSLIDAMPAVTEIAVETDQKRYLGKLLDWIEAHDGEECWHVGVFCLGRINPVLLKDKEFDQIVTLLKRSAEGKSSEGDAKSSYLASVALRGKANGERRKMLDDIANQLIVGGDLYVLLIASRELALTEDVKFDDDTCRLLDSLMRVGIKYAGILEPFDGILVKLLQRDFRKTIGYVEKYINIHENEGAAITTFPKVLDGIRGTKDRKHLDWCVTRWLLMNDLSFLTSVGKLMSKRTEDEDLGVHIDVEQIGSDQVKLQLVFQRAIGFFYNAFQSCTGFVVSVLMQMDDKSLAAVEQDFYYLFCFNLPHVVKSFLDASGTLETSKVITYVQRLYAEAEKDFKELEKVGSIKELAPTSQNKEAYYQYRNRITAEAHRQAFKNSIAAQLSTLITTIRGKYFCQYVKDPDGTLRRVATEMQHHSFKMFVPNLVAYNSLSLDAKLGVMRMTMPGDCNAINS